MRKFLAFLAGMMMGIVTGGTLAVLFAPESGSELQRQINHGIEQLIAEGKNAAEARRVELESQLESFKQGRPIVLQEEAA
ncbi:MAG: YtxH domain-containing protein [Anaerolineae bacterium]|nr:YtxH domain-containing protein [Anaerolineae bacterium]